MHCVVLELDHASGRSGPLVSGSSNLTVMFTESAGFTQDLVVVGAATAA